MNNRYFQWIVGERRGEVMVFDSVIEEDGLIFIVFKDGSRINEDLVAEINVEKLDGKLMAEVENPSNVWSFKDEWVGREEELWETNAEGESVCVIPFTPGRKVVHIIPPRKSTSKFGNLPTAPHHHNLLSVEILPQKNTINTGDPVYIMMDKSKKVDTEVNMTLTISLPSQSLFDVVSESFEDGSNKALEYIIENIDIKDIKSALRAGIDSMYTNKPIVKYTSSTDDQTLYEPIDIIENQIKKFNEEVLK